MNKRIFTGNYAECKAGDVTSVSGDRGESVGFVGKASPQLAPKRKFWTIWHNNIGKISDEANTRYYIQEYYRQVLSRLNLDELLSEEKDPILLCYEKGQEFCHRHVLAEYIEMKYGIKVRDIRIDENLNIEENKRPEYIRVMLEEIIEKEEKSISL